MRTPFWWIRALTQICFTSPSCKEFWTITVRRFGAHDASAPVLAEQLTSILFALLSGKTGRANALDFAVFASASGAIHTKDAILASGPAVVGLANALRHSGFRDNAGAPIEAAVAADIDVCLATLTCPLWGTVATHW